ncbi:MAG TPA: hypothetical protein ENN40_00895 [Candidatus Aminicenantes bacterium]|nr:hypothetical protein [Candidatus Aminicenantes bacterium]
MSKVKPSPFGWTLLLIFLATGIQVRGADFFKEREAALKTGRFQLGPFQVFPQFTLENLGYTDNIYGYNVESQPGWMADLGLRVKAVAVAGSRLVFIFNGHPYYSYFSAVDTERAFNYSLNGKIFTYLAGLHLMYSLNYDSLRWRPNYEFAARVRSYATTHLVEADIGNHTALFLTLYAGYSKVDYTDTGFMERFKPGITLDHNERDAGIKLNLPVFTATLLSLEVNLRQYRFDYSQNRNGKDLTSTLNIHFPEIGHLTGNASLGYKRYIPDTPGYAEFDTFYGSGAIIYRLLRRWRLQVSYTLDNRFSFYRPEYFYNERMVQAGLDYYMSRNMRVGFGYRTGRHDYRQLSDGTLEFSDNYQQYEARVVFRLAKTTGIGLSFRREEWDSQRLDLQRGYYFIGGYVTHDF